MIWVFFEDVNDGSVMELCFLEEIDEGIYEQLEIYNEKKTMSIWLILCTIVTHVANKTIIII